jgi:hypothetical protein
MSIAKRSYKLECGTDGWIAPPSGPTSVPLTAWSGVEAWTASLAASPASPSVLQAASVGPKTPATSGLTLHDSFARYDPASRSWRTYQGSFTEPTGEPYSETWPRAGTTCAGTVYRQQPLVPLTVGTDSGYLPTPQVVDLPNKHANTTRWGGVNSLTAMAKTGLWPTPSAMNPNESEDLEKWLTRRAETKERVKNGNGFGMPLGVAVRLWPTPDSNTSTYSNGQRGPNLRQAVQMFPTLRAIYGEHPGMKDPKHLTGAARQWPTPNARDWKGSPGPAHEAYSLPREIGGQLNPTWVEWLMGFPLGWSALQPLEMPS